MIMVCHLRVHLPSGLLAYIFLDILKKQAQQNQAEYDRLATEYNAKVGAVSDKRKD